MQSSPFHSTQNCVIHNFETDITSLCASPQAVRHSLRAKCFLPRTGRGNWAAVSSSATLRMPRAPCGQKQSKSFAACGRQTILIRRGGRSPLRHYDSRTFQVRQSCRFLETVSLFPPLAALRRFPCASAATPCRKWRGEHHFLKPSLKKAAPLLSLEVESVEHSE